MSRLSKRLLPVLVTLMMLASSAQGAEMPQLSISTSGGTLNGGVYQITYMASNDTFAFSWTDLAESYQVTIEPGSSFIQTENRISLTAAAYLHDTYTLSVSALDGEGVIASASVRFQLSQMDTTPQEADSSSGSLSEMGSMGGGGRGGFGSSQSITPGKALTAGHAEGSRDDSLYNTVDVKTGASAMTSLTLGETVLDIQLDDGQSTYTAENSGEMLMLKPVDGGKCWQISLSALNLLNRSGVNQLLLKLNGQTCALMTDWELTGRLYGLLKAQGLGSNHFLLLVDESGMRLSVDGTMYRITDNQLVQE